MSENTAKTTDPVWDSRNAEEPPKSDTPRTDGFCATPRGLGTGYYQAIDFARTLERELAAERAAALQVGEQWRTQLQRAEQAEKELDELRARLANSIDQNDLLAAIARRGFEVGGLDGDESPEDIVANWIAGEIGERRAKLQVAIQSLKEIADAYANKEPISAQWAQEALAQLGAEKGQP